jgi:hypothetical protein
LRVASSSSRISGRMPFESDALTKQSPEGERSYASGGRRAAVRGQGACVACVARVACVAHVARVSRVSRACASACSALRMRGAVCVGRACAHGACPQCKQRHAHTKTPTPHLRLG